MRRDLNELYGMVCNDHNEYTQAVQAVVTFSGLQGDELVKVLPKLNYSQPEPTINDIRGYTPYNETVKSMMRGMEEALDFAQGKDTGSIAYISENIDVDIWDAKFANPHINQKLDLDFMIDGIDPILPQAHDLKD